MITLIIISLIFATLSGFCKAIMDLSEQSDLKFTPTIFWIKNQSWKNKWKGGLRKNGEKFFGSSSWFVALTDGWHLFKSLMLLCLVSAAVLYTPLFPEYTYRLLEIFILHTWFGIIFELFFGTFFIKGELEKKWLNFKNKLASWIH